MMNRPVAITLCFIMIVGFGIASVGGQQQKVLVVATTAEPVATDFNPLKISSVYWLAITYPEMVGWDKDGKLVPGLAQSWNVSSDGLTYTFKLRDGLKWSDGEPITSEDVAFTMKIFSEQSVYWQYQWSPIQVPCGNSTATGFTLRAGAITTPDPSTVVFHLTAPSATFFIYAAGWIIIPKHYYEGINLLTSNPDLSTMVGSGPFIPQQRIPSDRVVYVANPYYWGGKPALDEVIFRFYRDSTTAEIALESGEAGAMTDVPAQDVRALKATPSLNIGSEEPQYINFLLFNLAPKLADGSVNPVADRRVRLAIAMSLDLNNIINSTLYPYYILANQLQVPNMDVMGKSVWNSSIPSPEYPYDPTTAGQLLDQAGWPVGPNGARFSLNFVLYLGRTGTPVVIIMQLIQSRLRAVGINMDVILLEATSAMNRIYNAPPPKDWNMAMGASSESPDPDDPAYWVLGYLPGNIGAGAWNAGGYDNPIVNKLILLGENTTNVDQRVAIYQRIDGIVHDDIPILPLYYRIEVVAWTTQFQGFILGLGNPMHDYWGFLKYQSLANVTETTPTTTTTPTTITTTTNYSTIIVAVVAVIAAASIAYYAGRRKKAT